MEESGVNDVSHAVVADDVRLHGFGTTDGRTAFGGLPLG